jgi:ankyrin repeat protein
MAPPQFPLELLLMIADQFLDDCADDDDELSLDGLKSFRQINRTLYHCVNPMFWQEALKRGHNTERVLTSLIRTNDLARLNSFLKLGIDIETLLPEFGTYTILGYHKEPTPLNTAADMDNVPLARLLLENGAKITFAMHYARSAEMVQLLLDFHADPEKKDLNNLTPLHWYAQHQWSISAMQAVLQHGVEVDPVCWAIPGWHSPPLHRAARWGNFEAVKLLLEFGADVHKKNQDSNTPLHLAAMAGEVEAMRLLVEHSPETMKVEDGSLRIPLHRAAAQGTAKVVEFLVDRWPEGIRVEDHLGNTPLHCAAGNGKAETMRLLVERWPEGIKAEDHLGNTPLHCAARKGNAETMRILVERWPEGMIAENKRLVTPLHLAATKRHSATVRVLVDCWPEGITAKDCYGNTLFHSAIYSWDNETVRLLVERWPEGVMAKNKFSETPLHWAAEEGNIEVVRLLVELWPEAVRMKDNDKKTPLALAKRFPEVVKLLTEWKARSLL